MQRARRTWFGWVLPPFGIWIDRLTAHFCSVLRFGFWRCYLCGKVLLARHTIHNDALTVAKLVLGECFERLDGRVLVARNVRRQKIRCAQIMVVAVQAVR